MSEPQEVHTEVDESEMRKVELLVDGRWQLGTWKDLRIGEVFRLFGPDGALVDAGTEYENSVVVEAAVHVPIRLPVTKSDGALYAPGGRNWVVKCDPYTGAVPA